MDKFKKYLGIHPFIIHLFAYLAIVVFIVVLFLQNNKQTEEIASLAKDNANSIVVIESVLANQKICGDSTPQYCQNLFERLATNISKEQEIRLACLVLKHLESDILNKDAFIFCPEKSPKISKY